ncbi:MAG: hypothetical protein EPN33_02230 [Acidobacteria bacterium]|nr:MAG: hypothetical protein EPN33_02230 [Acidobacteriota bacterium]
MRERKFSEEQRICIVREMKGGAEVVGLCRRLGLGRSMLYRWLARYGGMKPEEQQRVAVLELENRQLRQMLGEATLDNKMLRAVLAKKW